MNSRVLAFTLLLGALLLPQVAARVARAARAPDGASAKLISGTFLQLDAGNLSWDTDMWSQEFDAMRALGFDTVIVQYVAAGGQSFYPSDVLPSIVGAGDAVDVLLAEAAARKMGVWLGLSSGDWWERGDLNLECEENERVIDELAGLYAAHPAFRGWYIPHELAFVPFVAAAKVRTAFYGKLADYLHAKTPGKPVAIAPYCAATMLGKVDVGLQKRWEQFLAGAKVDVIMLQDGVGANPGRTPEQMIPLYKAMQQAATSAGVEFWNDLETFDISDWSPAPVERIVHQLEVLSPYVKKTVIFEFNHYMSTLRGEAQEAQYDAYKQYSDGGQR